MRILAIFCLLFVSSASAQETFGKLFTSPAERANLEYLRSITKDVTEKENQKQVQTEIIPTQGLDDVNDATPAPIAVEGFVKRSDGKKGTVWVNHEAILENTKRDDLSVGKLANDKNEVDIGLKNGKHVVLKAGQVYEISSNKRQEIAKPANN